MTQEETKETNKINMNILLVISSPDGPSHVAFSLSSLNLELKHHKELYDAVQLCLEAQKAGGKTLGDFCKAFGDEIAVDYGMIIDVDCFVSNMILAEAEFGDEDHENYDSRYKNISIQPPFQLDAVIKLRTFY